jgi:hypothetical protein
LRVDRAGKNDSYGRGSGETAEHGRLR